MNIKIDYLNAANDSNLLNMDDDHLKFFQPCYIDQMALGFDSSRLNSSKLFYELLEQMLAKEHLRLSNSEITQQTYEMLKCRINGHIFTFFGNQATEKITSQDISNFVDYLHSYKIGAVTIKQYLGLLKRALNLAIIEGFITKPIQFPKLKSKSKPRGSFTAAEYKKLLQISKSLSAIPKPIAPETWRNTAGGSFIKTASVPLEMRWVIGFMVNTFVRPVDIKLIKNKHIQVIDGPSKYLRISMLETKKHTGTIVSMRAAVGIFQRLLNYQEARGYGRPDDYVFFPEVNDRRGAIQLISGHFKKILDSSSMSVGVNGEKRTLYSLRHTAITFRLLFGSGIDLLTLARNSRTSVEMIERFYSSNLTPEMNVSILQSKRTAIRL